MKEKLKQVIALLLKDSRIPAMYAPISSSMVNKFVDDAKEEDLRGYVIQLRDEFIPWLLGEK